MCSSHWLGFSDSPRHAPRVWWTSRKQPTCCLLKRWLTHLRCPGKGQQPQWEICCRQSLASSLCSIQLPFRRKLALPRARPFMSCQWPSSSGQFPMQSRRTSLRFCATLGLAAHFGKRQTMGIVMINRSIILAKFHHIRD